MITSPPTKGPIVYLHIPPFSSGLQHGSDVTLQWPFRTWGASIVFAGHEHLYERILLDDFPYIVDGAGGAGLYDFSDKPLSASVVRFNGDWGAVKVDADSGSFQVQFITGKGSVIDTFSLTPAQDATHPEPDPQDRLIACVKNPSYFIFCPYYLSWYPFLS
jgi:tartrate-resistant acid phosphatase type 5